MDFLGCTLDNVHHPKAECKLRKRNEKEKRNRRRSKRKAHILQLRTESHTNSTRKTLTFMIILTIIDWFQDWKKKFARLWFFSLLLLIWFQLGETEMKKIVSASQSKKRKKITCTETRTMRNCFIAKAVHRCIGDCADSIPSI